MTAPKGGPLACLLVLVTTFGLAAPALCQDDGDARPDSVMSTKPRAGDTVRSGRNEQGDSTMRIEHTPKDQQGQSPQIGPIMVVPQVNQGRRPVHGGTTTVMPVPVDPSDRGNGR